MTAKDVNSVKSKKIIKSNSEKKLNVETASEGPKKIILEETPEVVELKNLLETERKNLANVQSQLQRSLADYQNLEKKKINDIQNEVNSKVDKVMVSILEIYEDLIRADSILSEDSDGKKGIKAILKNMENLLSQNQIQPIESLGEIFNPNFHEAISVIEDNNLDENTITKEIRKGYISNNRILRPSLVEISRKKKLK